VVLEIYKPVVIRGTKGEVKSYALIDTGATVCMLEKSIFDEVGASEVEEGVVCGINACEARRSGFVEISIEGCTPAKVLAFEGDMNIVGMNYMSYAVDSINVGTGEVSCKQIAAFIGVSI